jgi:hypothetical protein
MRVLTTNETKATSGGAIVVSDTDSGDWIRTYANSNGDMCFQASNGAETAGGCVSVVGDGLLKMDFTFWDGQVISVIVPGFVTDIFTEDQRFVSRDFDFSPAG